MSLDICRICGSNDNLKHVFNEGSEELIDQIRVCANIQIDAFDSLPKYVCISCEQGLAFSYRLRKRGEETEKKLRESMLVSPKIEVGTCSFDIESPTEELKTYSLDESCGDQWLIKDESNLYFNEPEELISSGVVEESEQETFAVDQEDLYEQEWALADDDDDDHVSHVDEINDTRNSEEFIGADDLIEENVETFSSDDAAAKIERVEEDFIELIDDSNAVWEEPVAPVSDDSVRESLPEPQANIVCETCEEVLETKAQYFEHVKSHGDQRFSCELCSKWFKARFRYEQHMKIHSSESGANPCPECGKSYSNANNLRRHIRITHEGEKRYQCEGCEASFGRADTLKTHLATHSFEKNVECNICQKRFKTNQSLHYHKRTHLEKYDRPKKPKPELRTKTNSKVKTYLCEYCTKISHHRTTHLNHLRTHTREKPYKCDKCGKSFRTVHARGNHMLLHTDSRPHQCNVCGVAFRQTAHLKSHMLIHSGIKRHVCVFCQKAFTMKSNLMVHMRMHTGEMPYACDKCPQRFFNLNQFKRHKASHTSEGEQKRSGSPVDEIMTSCGLNDSRMSSLIDEIIEVSPDDDVKVSECVIEEC